MPEVFNIILTTIAPIILVAGLGTLLDKIKTLEVRTLSRITIYLTGPALIFYGIANSSVKSTELGQLTLYSLVVAITITILAWLVTLIFKMNRLTASAFMLSIVLVNIGNYGIPLNEFAFGQPGLERAIIVVVISALYANTMGVFLASWGKAPISKALLNVLKVPTPYAAVLGLLVNFQYLTIPQTAMRIVGILQGAAVPLMLIILGIQIGRVSMSGNRWGIVFGASGMRLLGGAAVGLVWANVMGLEGITRQVGVVQASMPTAVMATILATEFDSDPQIASSVVLISTVLSIFTLSTLLYILS